MSNEDNILEAEIEIVRKIFFNNQTNFGIVLAKVVEIKEGEPHYESESKKTIIIKGNMVEPMPGVHCDFKGMLVCNQKYGYQYDLKKFNSIVDFQITDKDSKRKYLETLYTKRIVDALYDALEDPYEALKEGKVDKLVKTKGIGIKTANAYIKKFHDHYDKAKLYLELSDYELTDNMMNKLLKYYGSADLAIQTIKSNPYLLVELANVGWVTCDNIALKGGMDKFSSFRVQAYMHHFLANEAEEGRSWIDPDDLMQALVDYMGEDLPDEAVSKAVHDSTQLWFNDEHTKIGLKKYRKIEKSIAKNLVRLLGSKPLSYNKDYMPILKRMEIAQGWEFCEEQLKAIDMVLNNQVSIIIGYSGTGKSTIVESILKILNKYSFAQSSLSGKAASRLTEVTGEEGFTIHRLLGYPQGAPENGGFVYHTMNKLPYDIIIVDEISMVDEVLFQRLIQAIKNGAKLIMLGDNAQLPAIGCGNLATDLLASKYIPSIVLTQIHRQAAKSGMVTESIKVRKGIQLIPSKEWVGTEVRGELQDLLIDCYSDRTLTHYKIIEYFNKEFPMVDNNIMDIQVIVPRRTGDSGVQSLNETLQELVNPKRDGEPELFVSYGNNVSSILRIGDKVINTKNNYNTLLWGTDINKPVYNGSMGIITDILSDQGAIVVDFVGIGKIFISSQNIKSIELAYAVTLHKYQGSECRRVIYGLDFTAYSLLSREHVYTGITRAREHTTLVAQSNALRFAVSHHDVAQKQTHLLGLIENEMNPKFTF